MTIVALTENMKDLIHKAASESLEQSLNIIENHGFDSRDGWKLDCENKYATVHYKDIKGCRYFAGRTLVPITAAAGHEFNWSTVSEVAEWNSNVRYSRVVAKINETCDLIHYASEDKGPVKSRDFVVCRMSHVKDGVHIIAAKSHEISAVPENEESVRALLRLAFGRFVDNPKNSNESFYDYVISMDLKGMLPNYVVNQVMGRLVLSDVENYVKNLLKSKSEGN